MQASTVRPVRPTFEPLETRLLFSQMNYTVTTVADSGPGSLRQAIIDSNAEPAYHNVINFNIPGGGIQTIIPSSQLPLVTADTEIEGPTDASGNPLIQINGQSAGANASGLVFDRSTPGNTQDENVSGLMINRFALDGIDIGGEGHVQVFGCRIGTYSQLTLRRPNGRDGIRIFSPDNVIGLPYAGAAWMNVIDGNKLNGISIFGGTADGNVVQNNYIGLGVDGKNPVGNSYNGIWIDAAGNTIGGVNSNEGNVISGNHVDGIDSSINGGLNGVGQAVVGPNSAGPNRIFGNKIGTNAAGNAAVPNYTGIFLDAGSGTQIGDSNVASRNIVSGNSTGIVVQKVAVSIANDYVGVVAAGTIKASNPLNGISFSGDKASTVNSCVVSGDGLQKGIGQASGGIKISNSSGITIGSCAIGTNAGRTAAIANSFFGVDVEGSTGIIIKNNTIADNNGPGITVLGSNSQTTIEANSIYSNKGLGIQLGSGASPLLNDAGDVDTGPNGLQNYAVLTSAIAGSTNTIVKGTFNGAPNTKFRVDFFINTAVDASGYGEGQRFLGIITFTTNASGNASFSATLSKVTVGQFISSTATDAAGNTSEFSKDIKVT